MARRLYGSLQNRMEENRMYTDEIKVGTGMTEYSYSDRHAYEVVEVKDQKHVVVRRLDHKHVGDGTMDNNWELVSNEKNPLQEMTKRGQYWYWTCTVTRDEVAGVLDFERALWLGMHGFDVEVIRAKGKQTRYQRANVSFGVADYYYDYEF